MDLDFIIAARETASRNEDYLVAIERYIEDAGIHALWTQAVREVAEATGVRFGYAEYPARDSRTFYESSLTSTGIFFAGYDSQRDYHSFEIPWEFLIEETRQEAIDRLLEKHTASSARRREQERVVAERRRVEAEQELARAQKALDDLNPTGD